MARLSLRTRRRRLMRLFLHEAVAIIIWFFITVCTLIADYERDRPCIRYSLSNMGRATILHRHAYESDSMCISQLRMNRGCFKKLCDMLETRIKTMKKDWQVVHDMVNGTNTSGFGYDSVKQCVIAEAPVWESYLQVHKEAAKWKNKTFPHFEDLSIVFGKDRAQGSRARDVVEMEDEVNLEEQEQPSEDTESSHDVHNATEMRNEEGSSRGSKKRKNRVETLVDGMHSAALLLGEKFENASKDMVEMVRMEMEKDIQNKTSMVNPELVKIQSLSRMERFMAVKKITSEPNNVLIFWSLDESEREEWVRFILRS